MFIFVLCLVAAFLTAAAAGMLVPPLDFLWGARLALFHAVFVYSALVFPFYGALVFAAAAGLFWDLSVLPVAAAGQIEPGLLRPGWSVIFFGCAAALLNGLRPLVAGEGRWELHAFATGVVVLLHYSAEFVYITLARSAYAPPEFSAVTASRIGATALLALLTAPVVYLLLAGLESLCGSPVRARPQRS